MKGIILAGGTGTRLFPLTKVTNKHLLPIYNKPMIFYPLETLKKSGITDIMIVAGGENIGDFMKLLGSGKDYGVKLTYRVQDGAGGIPVALGLGKEFIGNSKFAVILGDNILEEPIKKDIEDFEKSKFGCKILLKKVNEPERFGIAEVKGNKVVKCYEKPEKPVTDLAIIGVYFFDSKAFEIIPKLKPSKRGELEITDIINYYIENKNITYRVIEGFWKDAGTFPSLFATNKYVAEKNSWHDLVRN